ncbi:MAG: PBP1A family penicillin-binding protein [Desulfuromonadales bacterium]
MNIPKWLRLALWAGAGSFLAGLVLLVGAYFYVAGSLPKVDTLADYRPPMITRVYSDDGTVIAEFARERRIVVPVSRMPKQLIEAFVSAEDSNFFEHQGIDLVSILRAAVKNVLAGGIVQGGSTITQQVAKSLLLTPERKFSRKFKEAILAWRMEKKLSKDDILYLYLNQIYLGHGAYGVEAAAEAYFDKNVEDLSLAQCAMLAGLPQAPSSYSPYQHFDKAKERQQYVLGRMVANGYISKDEAQEALAEEITIRPRVNTHIAEAAYFTEQVRRYLEDTFGAENLYTGGLEVHTSMNLGMQEAAQKAVQENLRNLDKRHGYRGPSKVLSQEEADAYLLKQQGELEKNPPAPGDFLEGILTGASGGDLLIRLGTATGTISIAQSKWAAPLRVVARGRPASGNATARETRLPIGSLLEVRVDAWPEKGRPRLSLEQEPKAQGALVALDPHTGEVKAMVGGYDFAQSQFNRVLQARRMPGSAIKPIIYAAALDKGYTPASIIMDTPVIYKEKAEDGEEVEWKPKNYEEDWEGPTSFRNALTHSRNVVTIKILEDIGVGYVANYAHKLGIESPITRDLTLALGSTSVTPLELATAGGPGKDQKLIRQDPVRVISPETAYLITNIMESVVRNGTGWRAKALGRPVAGKTGTTNDFKDAWFVGFVPQLVAVSWVGYDQEHSLGRNETGSRAAAPAWVAFMKDAVKNMPARNFPVPDDIVFRPIDPASGLLAPEDSPGVKIEAFAPGTAPTRYALDEKKPKARDFFKLDMEDR